MPSAVASGSAAATILEHADVGADRGQHAADLVDGGSSVERSGDVEQVDESSPPLAMSAAMFVSAGLRVEVGGVDRLGDADRDQVGDRALVVVVDALQVVALLVVCEVATRFLG